MTSKPASVTIGRYTCTDDEFGSVEPFFTKSTAFHPRLIVEFTPDPTPTAEPSLSGKAKKSLLLGLLLGGAFFAFLSPILAKAGLLSNLLQKSTNASSASATPLNSQTLPLLAPAINIDPHPVVGGGLALVGGGALLAQEGPSGTAADIESKPTSSEISVYTVHEGDTLSSIAEMFDVTPNTIVWANDIKNGTVHQGDTLVILPITGIQHTTRKGETLAGLARVYKSNVHEIAQYNDLADSATLAVGDVIIIPGGEITAPVVAKPKTTVISKILKNIAKGVTEPYLGGSGPALNGYFVWPAQGGVITQGLHGWNAVDIGAPKGTSIYAAADGVVLIARQNGAWNGGYGNYVVIKHDNGTQTLYAHASAVLVSAGDSVTQGQIIAKVGSSGESTGPHLHFEVRGAKNPFAD